MARIVVSGDGGLLTLVERVIPSDLGSGQFGRCLPERRRWAVSRRSTSDRRPSHRRTLPLAPSAGRALAADDSWRHPERTRRCLTRSAANFAATTTRRSAYPTTPAHPRPTPATRIASTRSRWQAPVPRPDLEAALELSPEQAALTDTHGGAIKPPPGTRHGQRIGVPGAAAARQLGGAPGDRLRAVHVRPDKRKPP